ncbi:MAG: hypothetical protein Q9190_001000, partial [Brigantiaea leucoxantha]
MLVARDYTCRTPTRSRRVPEKVMDRSHRSAERDISPSHGKQTTITRSTEPIGISAISPATPSQPVVIPTRTPRRRRAGVPAAKAVDAAESQNVAHDQDAVSSSVAALLAMTRIPEPTGPLNSRYRDRSRRDAAVKETSIINTNRAPLSNTSPRSWDVLLSPPDKADVENSLLSENSEFEHRASLRSLSSDSMPSLETDAGSIYSASSPSTPESNAKARTSKDRKQRSISSSVTEESNLDHPLLGALLAEQEEPDVTCSEPEHLPTISKRALPNKSLFKSNLTASFRLLKSAARSVSNLTTPASQRDDGSSNNPHPTPFSPSQYTDESRPPLPWAEPPDPALRRYLNPITLSPGSEMHTHCIPDRNPSSSSSSTTTRCTASIQMQTYQKGAIRSSSGASSPPIIMSSLLHDNNNNNS